MQPDGPEEIHVVFVDNGRSDILASDSRAILRCIPLRRVSERVPRAPPSERSRVPQRLRRPHWFGRLPAARRAPRWPPRDGGLAARVDLVRGVPRGLPGGHSDRRAARWPAGSGVSRRGALARDAVHGRMVAGRLSLGGLARGSSRGTPFERAPALAFAGTARGLAQRARPAAVARRRFPAVAPGAGIARWRMTGGK